jgi:hypothetical protein
LKKLGISLETPQSLGEKPKKITLQDYKDASGAIDTNRLYEDIISYNTNFSPETFFAISEEISKIPDTKVRNAIFQSFLDTAKMKYNRNNALANQRVVYRSDKTDKNKWVIADYISYHPTNSYTINIKGVVFQKTKLTDSQLLQVIRGKEITETPTTLKAMLSAQLNKPLQKKSISQPTPINRVETHDHRNHREEQGDSTKSIKDVSFRSILTTNPSLRKFIKEEGVSPITLELEDKRYQEGTAFAVKESLKADLSESELSSLISVKEGRVDTDGIKRALAQHGKTPEEIESIMAKIFPPDPEIVETYIEEQHLLLRSQTAPTIGAIAEVFASVKNYLNLTTKNEHKNFSEDFNLDSSKGVEITADRKMLIKGSLKNTSSDEISTPIVFSYDMAT